MSENSETELKPVAWQYKLPDGRWANMPGDWHPDEGMLAQYTYRPLYARALLAEDGRKLGLEEAAKVADKLKAQMDAAAAKPHPLTGRENTIAICKSDAARMIAEDIRALIDKDIT